MTTLIKSGSFGSPICKVKVSQKDNLRTLLEQKRQRQYTRHKAKLAGFKKPYAEKKQKSISDISFVPYGTTITVSGGTLSWGTIPYVPYTSYTQKDMDEANEKVKEAEAKLAASTDEIAGLRLRLDEAEKRAEFAESELEEFKTVAAFFLADFVTDVDNIMPDDLEYGLLHYEEQIEKSLTTLNDLSSGEIGWHSIWNLCRTLGMRPAVGINDTQEIKIFIKELARKHHQLEEINTQLQGEISDLEEAAYGGK